MPYLQFRGISKQFPGVRALDNVSFHVEEGSVQALLGENGAGKSTLLKILSGVYRPNSGEILVGGIPVRFANPTQAIEHGIAIIYQELNLVPEMTVAENLLLGNMPNTMGWLDKRQMHALAARILDRLGENIPLDCKLRTLSIAQQQMIEIAKALMRNAKIIAFDEPTSSLTDRETRKLFTVIRDLQQAGNVIIYVSHRLQEIFEICNAATVFRDGKVIETFEDVSAINTAILVNRMVGREIKDIYNYAPREHGTPILELRGLAGRGLAATLDLTVRRGEIVGMFGLVGAGRTELLKLIFGAARPTDGTILVEGERVDVRSPRDAIRAGVMLAPEDRKKEGIIPMGSVKENLNLSVRRHFSSIALIDERRERENAQTYVDKLAIKTPSLACQIQSLSGGNQQKVILGRWLAEDVKVLLLDEPTRGIDVGAKSEIYSIISKLAAQGIGLIVVSSDLPEVLGIADTILVMREGRIAARLSREEASEEIVLRHALPATAAAG